MKLPETRTRQSWGKYIAAERQGSWKGLHLCSFCNLAFEITMFCEKRIRPGTQRLLHKHDGISLKAILSKYLINIVLNNFI